MESSHRGRKRTRKACTACRKAKTSCSDQRPCTRCVRLKKQDQCVDVLETSSMSEKDRETWLRVARYLRDPSSMPSHVAEALEQQVALTLSAEGGEPSREVSLQRSSSAADEDVERLREANQELQKRLRAALVEMEREQSIQHSYYFFGLTTGADSVAVSHWGFPSTQLVHYNAQFRELAQRDDAELSTPGFTCKRLFMEAFVQRCVKILMFLSHGTVSSMTVPQVWKTPSGEPMNVTSMVYIQINRESGHVAKIIMASTPASSQSKSHTFVNAFMPQNISFSSNSPMNETLLQGVKDGIAEHVLSTRATPPSSASTPYQWTASAQTTTPNLGYTATVSVGGAGGPFVGLTRPMDARSPDAYRGAEGLSSSVAQANVELLSNYGQAAPVGGPAAPQGYYNIGQLPSMGTPAAAAPSATTFRTPSPPQFAHSPSSGSSSPIMPSRVAELLQEDLQRSGLLAPEAVEEESRAAPQPLLQQDQVAAYESSIGLPGAAYFDSDPLLV